MENNHPVCLYCNRSSDEAPLIELQCKGQEYWICPQHFPILIHKPALLAGKLPGAEALEPGRDPD